MDVWMYVWGAERMYSVWYSPLSRVSTGDLETHPAQRRAGHYKDRNLKNSDTDPCGITRTYYPLLSC